MERSINVCRICLKVIQEDELFYPIINNSIVLQRLNLITFVTIRNLQLTEEPVICETCIERLKEFADFKENIITNEFKIQCHQKKDVNLFLKSVSPNCEDICRTCFKLVQKGQNSTKKWKDHKSMFIKCNIHLNLNIARPSVMCENCYNILINMFRFVCNCIENEKRIVEHYGVYEKILEAEDLYCIFNDDKNRIPKEKIENLTENEKNNNKVPGVSKLEFNDEIKSEIEETRKLKNNSEDQNVENEEPQYPKRKTKNEKCSITTEQPKGRKITRSSPRNRQNKDEEMSPKRRGRQRQNKGKNEIISKNEEIEAKKQITTKNAANEKNSKSKIEETENNNVEILNKKQTVEIDEDHNHNNEDVIVISEENERRNEKKQNNETITITEEQEENKQKNFTQNDVTTTSEETEPKERKKKGSKKGKNKKNKGKNASKASIEETNRSSKNIVEEKEEEIEATSIKRVYPIEEHQEKEEEGDNKKSPQNKKGKKRKSKIMINSEDKNYEEQKSNKTIDIYNFEEENEIEENYCSKNLKNNEETKTNDEKCGINQDPVDKPKTRSSKRSFNTVVEPIKEERLNMIEKTPNEDTKPKRKPTKREETQEINLAEEEPKRRRKRGKPSPVQTNKSPAGPKAKRAKTCEKNDPEVEKLDSANEFSTQSLIDILEGKEAEENRSNAEKSPETQPQSTRDPDWLLEHRPKPDWMRSNRDKPDLIEHVTEITEHDPHNQTIMYSCDRCGYKTKSHDILVKHRLVHNVLDTVQKFKCAVCHFQTKSHELLKQHVAVHVRADCSDISYGCIHCEHKAKKKVSVLHHTIRHPTFTDSFYCRVVKDDESPKEDNRSFECLQCEFQSTNDVDMKGHLVEHQLPKRSDFTIEMFKCGKCSYKTKQRELLQRHERMHALDPTIKTEVEDESERFKCEFCTFTGDTKRALLIHIKMKHLGKREPEVKKEEEDGELYYCAECPYVTRRKANMPRHALVHRTRENMEFFECSHCPFETKHKRSYKRHMETIHKINV